MSIITTIRSADTLSNTTYHRRCHSAGQQYWWLRGPNGFVEIPRVRGDHKIEVTLDLDPGTYTLGTGPAGSFGRRQMIEVA